MASIDDLLHSYRADAISERDKGAAFEKLVASWLITDPVQAKRFGNVELWSDWARRHNRSRADTGIDLVGTLHAGGQVAIQCKFLEADRSIQKQDIDSFISASAKSEFAERLIVETTERPWSPHANEMLRGQAIPTPRIGLRDLRESPVDWSDFFATGEIHRPDPKQLRPDQIEALEAVRAGLDVADRGKLIMACGTGKTLTSLRIAEDLVGPGGHVLVLVPSLALMAQTVREWCADALVPLTAFAVCSDTRVGRRRRNRDDVADLEVTDLAFPATTDGALLAEKVAISDSGEMRVIFATYHSISVIENAQRDSGFSEFDLIICDEAHRTTGATFPGDEPSSFVKVHDNRTIRGCKRLYMTATPRIYGESAKSKARETETVLASMDKAELYGEVLYFHGFAQAVESGILSDYRVIVLAVDEGQISAAVPGRLAAEDSELELDDASKIVGCWKALSKIGIEGGVVADPEPMRRAIAFCSGIESSKLVRTEFGRVIAEYREKVSADEGLGIACEVKHVDGTYNARDRGKRLDWLAEDVDPETCRILSNARCLTEGVDVPALDAILFLHPRNSQIDVVQAVGRVMRKSEGKRMGYVILPVGVPAEKSADEALNDNKKYRVVWQILNALRAHDERLDAIINQGRLGQDISDRIAIVDGRAPFGRAELGAVTATIDKLPRRAAVGPGIGRGGGPSDFGAANPEPLPLVNDELSRAVMAKIVEKCGTREYWEDWAKDVAKIAERHVTRISALVQTPVSTARAFFQDFLAELRDDLNEAITERDAIEMLAQHLVTRPVFEALFETHEFTEKNPVSRAMTEVLSVIDEAKVGREAQALEGFYASVRRRAAGITDPQARQNLILELYEKFFRGAFPRTAQMLGIVYTPVEIVDFIIRSANDVLQQEFNQTLGSDGVHILDPFTGTGTFITRLLQSGLIAPEDLERKYREEIHANEIVLLAYYIAAVNVETVFHSLSRRGDYVPYSGICLTDTFAIHENDDAFSSYMPENTGRLGRQKDTEIQVIIGNPPYSGGQRSQDDNAKNVKYPILDQRIRDTYKARSSATLHNSLFDSYIRAIRWGSDRIGQSGIMAYVTGGAWVERVFADGLRRCLADEFAAVYVFHLRGDIRKNMLSGGRAGEGENVFGQSSGTGIAISVFVKNPDAAQQGRIFFHDIGANLDRVQKLGTIKRFGSIGGIDNAREWNQIIPDSYGDWLDQRDSTFYSHPAIGDKKDKAGRALFENYAHGIATTRDAWCINPSRAALETNVEATVRFYNSEVSRWKSSRHGAVAGRPEPTRIDEFITIDPRKISWSHFLKQELGKGNEIRQEDGVFVPCMYRPFSRQWQYFSRRLNEAVSQMPHVFPNIKLPNSVIAVSGKGGRSGFSALMIDALPDYGAIEKCQCFPFWLYGIDRNTQVDLLEGVSSGEKIDGYWRRDAITEFGLQHFRAAYPSENVSREDVFHYIYGLLHSEDYRTRFRANLLKELPRIPCVKSAEDYRAFRDAGKRLGELHVGYENVTPHKTTIYIRGGGGAT